MSVLSFILSPYCWQYLEKPPNSSTHTQSLGCLMPPATPFPVCRGESAQAEDPSLVTTDRIPERCGGGPNAEITGWKSSAWDSRTRPVLP